MKQLAKHILKRFPSLEKTLLASVRAPLSKPLYLLFPNLCNTIAYRHFAKGDFVSARRELGQKNTFHPLSQKIAEIDGILQNGFSSHLESHSPVVERKEKAPPLGDRVLHVLHMSLPDNNSGYSIRSHQILQAMRNISMPCSAVVRPGGGIGGQVETINYLQLDEQNLDWQFQPDSLYIDHYSNRLIQFLKKHPATILHAHSNYLNGIATSKTAKAIGIPCIYEVRGLWHLTQAALQAGFESTPLFEYCEQAELHAMNEADHIVTLSTSMKLWMVERGIESDKISIIPNHIELRDFSRIDDVRSSSKIFRIGYCGTLNKYEGLDELLHAFKSVTQKIDAELYLVGDGPNQVELISQVKRLGIESKVRFLGGMERQLALKQLDSFDICVLPRLDGAVSRMVPPIKVLEAMAAGKPVVISDLPALCEIVGSASKTLKFPSGNTNAMAEIILRLHGDEALQDALSLKLRKRAIENYSWAIGAQIYHSLYKRMVKAPPSS